MMGLSPSEHFGLPFFYPYEAPTGQDFTDES